MSVVRTLKQVVSEDGITCNPLFHCALCDVSLTTKHEWIWHVNGRAHDAGTTKKSSSVTACIEELVSKTKHSLGDQNKFIVCEEPADVYKFTCLLCNVELSSYFALHEHVQEGGHESVLKRHHTPEEQKNCCPRMRVVSESPNSIGFQPAESTESTDRTRSQVHEPERSSIMSAQPSTLSEACNMQTIADAVTCLSRVFKGELRCTRCDQKILLNVSLVNSHLRNCIASLEIKSVKDRFEQYIEQSCQDAVQTNLREMMTLPEKEMNSIAGQFNSLQSSSFATAVTSATSFECISCDVTGNISKWEDHLIKHHFLPSIQSKQLVPDTSCVTCLCVMCNVLLFGIRDRVANHNHFLAPQGFEYFALNAYPYLRTVLQPSAEVPRYYKFCWKLAVRTTEDSVSQLAFYCLACDYYGMQNAKRHFRSVDHRNKAHPMYEFHYCDLCTVAFYCDRQLFDDHRQSPAHVLAKCTRGSDASAPAVVDKEHATLLLDLKKILRSYWPEYQAMNNCQHLAHWCDVCGYRTHQWSGWRSHLDSGEHIAQVPVEGDYFEHPCVVCKVLIFASAKQHSAHFASSGHLAIKSMTACRYNRQRLLQEREMPDQSEVNMVREHIQVPRYSELLYDVETKTKASAAMPSPAAAPNGATAQSSAAGGVSSAGKARKEETFSIDLDADLCTLKLDAASLDTENTLCEFMCKILGKQDCTKRVKNFMCAFCDRYFSKERTWWYHLKQPEHFERVTKYYADPKSTEAICLLCQRCLSLSLGAYVLRSVHLNSKAHRLACSRPVSAVTVAADTNKAVENSNSSVSIDDDVGKLANGVGVRRTEWRNSSLSVNLAPANGDKYDAYTEDYLSDEEAEDDQDGEDVEDELYNLIEQGDSDIEKVVTSDDEGEKSSLCESQNGTDVDQTITTKSNAKEDEEKTDETAEKRKIEYEIAVRGIPRQALRNKQLMYQTFSKYVTINGTFTRTGEPGCLYILVTNPEESFKSLKKNMKQLKVRLGTDELTVDYSTRNYDNPGISAQLSAESKLLFSNMEELENGIYHLMNKYGAEANSPNSRQRIYQLETDISRLATMIYRNTVAVKAHIFGSRVTGLAAANSDVDIYLQIGNSFRGSMHDNSDLQRQLVVLFAKEMKRYSNEFRNITSIPFARVPIVKFTHVRSNLNCDLSFKSGLSTMNSILVKTYLELDDRIKFLVCGVKLWMACNDLADRNLFTTYAQIWMVLFFLMQPQIAVVPTVIALKFMLPPGQQDFTVEGWNCSFPNIRNIVWRSTCTMTEKELLLKFFEFYSDSSLIHYVLCTLTGIKIEKKHFIECYESLPTVFRTFKLKMSTDRVQNRKVLGDFESLCIQDPFDHCHNLTKTINSRKFACFVELCKQTVQILKL